MTEQEQLVELEPYVKRLVNSLRQHLPKCVTLDDLMCEGRLGALKAIRNYDPKTSVPLPYYVRLRVRGHVNDYLRGLDNLSRGQRAKVKSGQEEDIRVVSLDRCANSLQLRDRRPDPESSFLASEEQQNVQKLSEQALRGSGLSDRYVMILTMYFYEDRSMHDIATQMGIHESRVCQITNDGLAKIRKCMGADVNTKRPRKVNGYHRAAHGK